MWYDLHVCWPDDEKTLDEIIKMAKVLGFSGIGLVYQFEDKRNFEEFVKDVQKKDTKLDLVRVAELPEKDFKQHIQLARELADVILVSGCVKDGRADIIAPKEKIKIGAARLAATHEIALELNVCKLLQSSGKKRVKVWQDLAWNARLAKRFKIPIILVSGASDKWGLRGPRELAAIAQTLGLERKESLDAVSLTPKKLVEMNRKKLAGKIRYRGVEVVG